MATLRAKDVYPHINAYKKIGKEGVEKGSARYEQLMIRATNTFKMAVLAEAKGKYTLVAEEGGVSGYPIIDITHKIIERIP